MIHHFNLRLTLPALLSLAVVACAQTPMAKVTAPTSSTSAAIPSCKAASKQDIAALLERWNDTLQTGNPAQVVANYADRSVLLPLLSNQPRLTPSERADYFQKFLESKPSVKVSARTISIDCNTAFDTGLYTISHAKTGAQVQARYSINYQWSGQQWLITSDHASAMPEKTN